jgi:hypothetical protein
MNKPVNPEIVRINLLRLSKVSLGLDCDETTAAQLAYRLDSIKVPAVRLPKKERIKLYEYRSINPLARLLYR